MQEASSTATTICSLQLGAFEEQNIAQRYIATEGRSWSSHGTIRDNGTTPNESWIKSLKEKLYNYIFPNPYCHCIIPYPRYAHSPCPILNSSCLLSCLYLSLLSVPFSQECSTHTKHAIQKSPTRAARMNHHAPELQGYPVSIRRWKPNVSKTIRAGGTAGD